MSIFDIHIIHTAAVCVYAGALVLGAGWDVASYRIPNALSLVILGAFVVAALVAGLSVAEIGRHLGVGAAVFAVGLGLFFVRVLGGGDVKLMAATAVWTAGASFAWFLLVVALVGGVVALCLLVLRWSSLPLAKLGRLRVPYGVAIAVGGLAVLVRFAGVEPVFDIWR